MSINDKVEFIKRSRVSELSRTIDSSKTSYLHINPDAITYCVVDTQYSEENCELIMNNGDIIEITIKDYEKLIKK